MSHTLLLDLETYSPVDLKAAGAYAYAEHPEHEVLMCGYSIDGGPARVAVGEAEIWGTLGPPLSSPSVLKIAHNAQFDRVNISPLAGCAPGEYLDPAQWGDTMALASENGLPASLDKLAKALGAEEKDGAGTRLINLFSKPDRHGNRRTPEGHPEQWAEFVDYCRQDVDTLVDVHRRLPDWPHHSERTAWEVDQRINDRGIKADVRLAEWALAEDNRNRAKAEFDLRMLLQIENSNSVQQVMAGLKGIGLELPNLRVATVTEALERDDLTDAQRQALELRAEIALTAARKYQAIIHGANDDGRLRGQFKFYGAHTGRWSGRGVQLQNLPRAELKHPEAVILDSQLGLDADAPSLKALIRQALVGPFVVADYAAIEARVLAWVAGERWALDAFAEGRDIYVETAERMGGLSRQQGKVAVLALGYQGGVGSLHAMGAKGTDEELNNLKVAWRRANRRIVRLWADLDAAFSEGGRAGRLRVSVRGRDRLVHLPSGRHLTYRNVRHETWRFRDADGDLQTKQGWRFDGNLGRTDTYGGRLTENTTQAIARDILADLLVGLERLGMHTVGHVHDEVLVDAPADAQRQEELLGTVVDMMGEAPAWADGLPLSGEGFITERYRKG